MCSQHPFFLRYTKHDGRHTPATIQLLHIISSTSGNQPTTRKTTQDHIRFNGRKSYRGTWDTDQAIHAPNPAPTGAQHVSTHMPAHAETAGRVLPCVCRCDVHPTPSAALGPPPATRTPHGFCSTSTISPRPCPAVPLRLGCRHHPALPPAAQRVRPAKPTINRLALHGKAEKPARWHGSECGMPGVCSDLTPMRSPVATDSEFTGPGTLTSTRQLTRRRVDQHPGMPCRPEHPSRLHHLLHPCMRHQPSACSR